jgi:hypothetical protein
MLDLLAPAETAAYELAPGLTLFRHFLDEKAQRPLASEITEIVSAAPWFSPRMPRSGRAFSVKMTNCGRLGWVSDHEGGYRYQAKHPLTGESWPSIPVSVLNIWCALASYPHLPKPASSISTILPRRWACTKIATKRTSQRPWSQSHLATAALFVMAACAGLTPRISSNCAPETSL